MWLKKQIFKGRLRFKINYPKQHGLLFISFLLAFVTVNAQNLDTRLLQRINSNSTKNDKLWLAITNSVTPIAVATPLSLYAMGHLHYIPKGKENAYATAGSLLINSA